MAIVPPPLLPPPSPSPSPFSPFQERQLRWEEYRELAQSLLHWLRDATAMMLDRNFPATLIEMKVLSLSTGRIL